MNTRAGPDVWRRKLSTAQPPGLATAAPLKADDGDDTAAAPAPGVYFADSMSNVPRAATGARPKNAGRSHRLALAANEFEGVQLVVQAGAAAVEGLRWAVDGVSESLSLSVSPIGYVHSGNSVGCPFNVTANPLCTYPTPIDCGDGICRQRGKFACRGCSEEGSPFPTDVLWCLLEPKSTYQPGCVAGACMLTLRCGWRRWPYPVLDFVEELNVAPHTAQPLLLTAHAAASAAAANHTLTVTLTTGDGKTQLARVVLTVEVYGFALPSTPSLPTFWGVSERDNAGLWGPQAATTEFSDRFADFLLDHRIPVSSVCKSAPRLPVVYAVVIIRAVSVDKYPSTDGGIHDWKTQYTVPGLKRLWARGQRSFNLAGLQTLPITENETSAFYSQVVAGLALTDAAGLPRNATTVD